MTLQATTPRACSHALSIVAKPRVGILAPLVDPRRHRVYPLHGAFRAPTVPPVASKSPFPKSSFAREWARKTWFFLTREDKFSPRTAITAASLLVAVGVSFWAVSWWLRVASSRLGYPYEVEWMEGGMLTHVARVLAGQNLYPEPAPEFMPFLYMPMYHYVSAGMALVTGLNLFSLRLVSSVAALVSFGLLYALVFIETRNHFYSTIGVGVFAATFEASGGWFDVGRVDSLALALMLGACVVMRVASGSRGVIIAGVLTGAAFLTKQSCLVIFPALAVQAFAICRWRGLLAYGLALAGVTVPVVAVLQITTHGWFGYYVFELPMTHGMKGREYLILNFWKDDIARTLPVAATVATLMIAGFPVGRLRFLLGTAVLLVVGTYAARLHMGSWLNDLMPAYAAVAAVFAVGLHRLVARFQDSATAYSRATAAACVLVVAQVLFLHNDLGRFRPSVADKQAGERVVELLRSTSGEVLVVNHPHLAMLAGKSMYAHQMALVDVYEAERDPRGVRELLRTKWLTMLQQKRFDRIVLDNNWYVYWPELNRYYRLEQTLTYEGRALMPLTGTQFRPELVFVPK